MPPKNKKTVSCLCQQALVYGQGVPRNVSMPEFVRRVARVSGMSARFDSLLGSLVIDGSMTRDLLGWQQVVTMDEQLREMALANRLQ